MKRTQGRPLVTGELTDREALVFAYGLGAASIAWLWLFTNWLAAALSLGAILLYVVFYSLILKRRTSQNIVWGGVAGCMPVLIGWAAVTGEPQLDAVHPVPHHLPLDAAALLAAVDEVQGRLRRRRRADARRRAGPRAGRPAGHPLRVGDRRLLAAAHPRRRHGPAVLDASRSSPASGSSTRPTASTTSRSGTSRSRRCGCSTARSRTCRCSSSRSGSTRCCRSEPTAAGRTRPPARGSSTRALEFLVETTQAHVVVDDGCALADVSGCSVADPGGGVAHLACWRSAASRQS